MSCLSVVVLLLAGGGRDVRVATDGELRAALAGARAGDTILVAPGVYRGGIHAVGLAGTEAAPIVVAAADPDDPPVIRGGGSGLQLSDPAWVELRDLVFEGATGNGLNIDDGGTPETPAHHVTLRRVVARDVGPEGNCDGIKLSGLVDFRVEDCELLRWGSGGSGVDMVGCRRGEIVGTGFRHEGGRGGSGVQMKGGTRDVAVRRCRFVDAGQRAVNLGGSTGRPYFRPADPGHEAKDLLVEDCIFEGSTAPVAFVGVDGAIVRHNTIRHPGKWVLRILQESRGEDFVPCRNGRFERNVVVFRAADVRTAVNVGPGTAPGTFVFAENLWFAEDEPSRSRPELPVAEKGGVYGKDPAKPGVARGYGVREE